MNPLGGVGIRTQQLPLLRRTESGHYCSRSKNDYGLLLFDQWDASDFAKSHDIICRMKMKPNKRAWNLQKLAMLARLCAAHQKRRSHAQQMTWYPPAESERPEPTRGAASPCVQAEGYDQAEGLGEDRAEIDGVEKRPAVAAEEWNCACCLLPKKIRAGLACGHPLCLACCYQITAVRPDDTCPVCRVTPLQPKK